MARLRGFESRRRDREFVRLLALSGSVAFAVEGSLLDARRLPKLLDDPAVRAVAAVVLADPPVAKAA